MPMGGDELWVFLLHHLGHSPFSLFLFFKILYQSIVDLHYYLSFKYTAKRFSYTSIHMLLGGLYATGKLQASK